ncbi:MAG: Uncharacterized protein XD60_0029 [Acetothermia bacterium 64_32]|nr:MAG: Uncharacterized protein XD60_0029 [Acetothermia bacterium 64_32]HAF70098.1 hypothetical protein [Candidatus Acetothermia bacterium]
MDRYVVHASVAASLVLPDEPYHEVSTYLFERFARGELELVTVPLLNFEVANALWKAVRLGRTQISTAMEAMKQIEGLRIPTGMIPAAKILEIAHGYGRTAYDAAYLALALREAIPLVTADKRFYNAIKGRCDKVVWIESVK